MGLFGMGANAQIDAWLETVTMAELDAMEKQGLDVKAWKERVAARDAAQAAALAARFETQNVDPSTLSNPVHLERLNPYKQIPRDVNSEFVKAVAGKLPLFGKSKHLQNVADGILLFAAVVQANTALWQPGDNEYYPAVLVFALDEAHRYDIAWLKETARKIAELKDSGSVPDDCRKLVNTLRDDQSDFCWKIGSSISGGADAWCAVHNFPKQAALPKKCLPSEGIIPFVLKNAPEEKVGVWFHSIPASYYE